MSERKQRLFLLQTDLNSLLDIHFTLDHISKKREFTLTKLLCCFFFCHQLHDTTHNLLLTTFTGK